MYEPWKLVKHHQQHQQHEQCQQHQCFETFKPVFWQSLLHKERSKMGLKPSKFKRKWIQNKWDKLLSWNFNRSFLILRKKLYKKVKSIWIFQKRLDIFKKPFPSLNFWEQCELKKLLLKLSTEFILQLHYYECMLCLKPSLDLLSCLSFKFRFNLE
jgi:hypothetical protein